MRKIHWINIERKALSTIDFKSAKADMGYNVERKALSTIDIKSAKADMGHKNGKKCLAFLLAATLLFGMTGVSVEAQEISADTQESSAEIQGTLSGLQEPAGEPQTAPSGTQEPAGESQTAPSGTQEPAGGPQTAPSGTQEPAGGPQTAPSGTQEPAGGPQTAPSGTQEPAGEPQTAPSGTQEPVGGLQTPPVDVPTRSFGILDEEMAGWIEAAGEELTAIAQEREIMALVYLSDEYPVREQPSYDSPTVVNVPSGQLVNIRDVYVTVDEEENPQVWYNVSLFYGEGEYTGYVPRYYLAVSDERFLGWEETYGLNLEAAAYSIDAAGNAVYADIEQFPQSYRSALLALKQKHPNWTFAVMNTGLDWNTVIANELTDGKSLVYKTFPDYAKEGLYDEGNWYYASEAVLKQYMDPRNALTEDAVFQFEQLTYNPTYHTEAAVNNFLQSTFMHSGQFATGTNMTYGHIFWAVGREEMVSPFHLASRVYQEQGRGTSALISGTYPGYEGYYNYFNVRASGKTDKEVIENGLKYAREKGWINAYYSILGGTQVISANYIKKGQDTLYLQKYNVNPHGYYALYTHQYMQNISAPTSEAKSIKKLYESAGALDNTFVFKIPVYLNMPEEACGAPVASNNITLNIPAGYTDTIVWLDGVAYAAEVRNGQYIVTAPHGGIKTAVVYQYNGAGVPVGMFVWTLDYKNSSYTATAQPELANLLTYHGFSIRITGKSGIRFKTGISADLRSRLTSVGVNGYTLREYGTLVMNNANRVSYPMVLGGEKVLSGMSFGFNASGAPEDKIYETVDGRHRFTSVLVGLPVNQYKTEYAFRGYIILEKGGSQITLYGPVVAKSIYALADQLIKGGSYGEGTEVYNFLKNLMNSADAL